MKGLGEKMNRYALFTVVATVYFLFTPTGSADSKFPHLEIVRGAWSARHLRDDSKVFVSEGEHNLKANVAEKTFTLWAPGENAWKINLKFHLPETKIAAPVVRQVCVTIGCNGFLLTATVYKETNAGRNIADFNARVDGKGRLLWTKTVRFPKANIISYDREIVDNGIIAVGAIKRPRSHGEVSVYKLDHFGRLRWIKLISARRGSFNAYRLEKMSNGDLIFAGQTLDSSGRNATELVRLDSNGNMIWRVPLSKSGNFDLDPVTTIASSDGVITVLALEGDARILHSKRDSVIFNIDSSGKELSRIKWKSENLSQDMIQLRNRNLAVIGYRDESSGVTLSLCDSAGKPLKTRSWGLFGYVLDDGAFVSSVQPLSIFQLKNGKIELGMRLATTREDVLGFLIPDSL